MEHRRTMKPESSSDKTRARLDGLLTLMGRLTELHDQLHAVLVDKVASMRNAELTRLMECVERERGLAVRINEQEGLRKQMMEQLGRAFGMSAQTARSLSARKLAERLAPSQGRRVEECADRLRSAVDRVRKTNEFVGRVAAQVLQHVREVFSAVSGARATSGVYTKRGAVSGGVDRATALFEAIG